jgi:hypothetical protein
VKEQRQQEEVATELSLFLPFKLSLSFSVRKNQTQTFSDEQQMKLACLACV